MGRRQFANTCQDKIRNTRGEAESIARRQGIDAYPCPYSVGAYHWHTGRPGPRQKDPNWYRQVDQDAKERGGLGWPEGYMWDQIRKRRGRRGGEVNGGDARGVRETVQGGGPGAEAGVDEGQEQPRS